MGRRWNLRDKLTRGIVMKKKKHSFGLDNTNIGNGWFVPTPSKFMIELVPQDGF